MKQAIEIGDFVEVNGKLTHKCNVFDARLASVARIAANGVRVARLRMAEAMPEPLWDIRERRVLSLAIKRGDLVAVATTEARLNRG